MQERMRVWLLVVAAILVYLNALPNGFTYDDQVYIVHNPVVAHPSLRGFLRPLESNNVFRPVYIGSFVLNRLVGGMQPFGYHLLNVLLHAAAVILLYFLLQALLESSSNAATIAFATALLFAVH